MKILRSIAFMFMALCIIGFAAPAQTQASAFNVQSYWNGDVNYPLAFSQAGVNRYLDLSSAKLEEQSTDPQIQVKSSVLTYDVIMVDGDKTTKFSYKTLVKTGGEATYIYGWKGTGWSMLTNRSFNQPQYNAALILIDHFNLEQAAA